MSQPAAARAQATCRADYPRLLPMTTRLRDSDFYGHMNNVVYNEYFDTAVNQVLIELGVLDPHGTEAPIGLVVHSQTSYFRPVTFPDPVVIGLRIARLGNTSITYEFALFRGDDDSAAAQGSYVHAFVDPVHRQPVALPDAWKTALAGLVVAAG